MLSIEYSTLKIRNSYYNNIKFINAGVSQVNIEPTFYSLYSTNISTTLDVSINAFAYDIEILVIHQNPKEKINIL